MPPVRVLCVAEKPSAAREISMVLAGGSKVVTRNSFSKYNRIMEFDMTQPQEMKIVFTSVSGHIKEVDFEPKCQSWQSYDPALLLNREASRVISRVSADKEPLERTLKHEARHCQVLILWLDCDSEGEKIAFEVMEIVKSGNPRIDVKRARFSAITRQDLFHALCHLQLPNERVADMVSARQEIDLRAGAAFTRFLTLLLTERFGGVQAVSRSTGKKQPISYGPCQFPALGLVVDRFLMIKNFKSQAFYVIDLLLKTRNGIPLKFEWARQRLFDQHAAQVCFLLCHEAALRANETARVCRKQRSERRRWKPLPLSTVEMQIAASRKLQMTSEQAMNAAEALYTNGFISYPRTETDVFNPNIDLRAIVAEQAGDARWSGFVSQLLGGDGSNENNAQAGGIRFERPRAGKHDDQAHPPIHPLRCAPSSSGFGDPHQDRLFEYITRRFLASCSVDAVGSETLVEVQIGMERFSTKALIVERKGFYEVFTYERWAERDLPDLQEGDEVSIDEMHLRTSETEPPPLLAESDLISLMDRHGIGTDATIAEHVKKIQERGYVTKNAQNRFVPMTLGLGLVSGFELCEVFLARPTVRAEQEAELKRVGTGEVHMDVMLSHAMDLYRTLFTSLLDRRSRFVSAFEPYFDRKHTEWTVQVELFSLCRCGRPMQLAVERGAVATSEPGATRERALLCSPCALQLKLPRNNSHLVPFEHTCPICRFQVLEVHNHTTRKTHKLCPWCFSFPPPDQQAPLDQQEQQHHVTSTGIGFAGLRCFACTHADCALAHGEAVLCDRVLACTICQDGKNYALVGVRGRFKIKCESEHRDCYSYTFPGEVLDVRAAPGSCVKCSAQRLQVSWKPRMVPSSVRALMDICVWCDGEYHAALHALGESPPKQPESGQRPQVGTRPLRQVPGTAAGHLQVDIEDLHNQMPARPAANASSGTPLLAGTVSVPVCRGHQLEMARRTTVNGKNAGREFFTCSRPQAEKCDDFVWVDQATTNRGAAGSANNASGVGPDRRGPPGGRKKGNGMAWQSVNGSEGNTYGSGRVAVPNENTAPLCSGHARPMNINVTKKAGTNEGRQFWSCSAYPNSCNSFKWVDGVSLASTSAQAAAATAAATLRPAKATTKRKR